MACFRVPRDPGTTTDPERKRERDSYASKGNAINGRKPHVER
jgi:hypothetical protein